MARRPSTSRSSRLSGGPPKASVDPSPSFKTSVAYPYLTRDVRPGDSLLLSDGDLELEVVGTTDEDVRCRVVIGGSLASRKGVNLPARSITAPTFTEKDRDDLAFGLRHGVDYVALSFVRTVRWAWCRRPGTCVAGTRWW
jgi:pyruvate kinase